MSILREWLSSGALYALWASAFALTGAPQQAFNVVPPAAGLVAAYVAFLAGNSAGYVWPSLLLAALCGPAFALGCHVLVVAPLLKSRDAGRAILLATIGILGVTQALIALLNTSELVSLRSITGIRPIFEYAFSDSGIWVVDGFLIVSGIAVIWVSLQLNHAGLLYRGVCDNREAARFYRLPVARIDLYATGLAGLVAAIAGILTAGGRAISPSSGLSFAIWGIAGAVIGGRKDLRTAFAGGLILGLVEILALRYFPSAVKDILIGAMLVVVLLVRPDGIFKSKARRV
ncbi:MAG: branched-chain amino acid transport system permease protein [Bradyrhizobium sp.]|nr:branched-chain amino acid transport system permease protein [Bradyrhizobium sp.]